jgi:hypothetical protein
MSKLDDNIKTDLKETGFDVDWIQLAQNRAQWRKYIYIFVGNTSLNVTPSLSEKVTEGLENNLYFSILFAFVNNIILQFCYRLCKPKIHFYILYNGYVNIIDILI